MNSSNIEVKKLESISNKSLYNDDIYIQSLNYSFKILQRHLRSGNILELGPAEGLMTDRLYGLGRSLTVVEGASRFCREISARCVDVKVINSLFEEFDPVEKFDNIILGHVLEHVVDPLGLLRKIAQWLAPGGMIFAAVPNSRSLHRQAAVCMGLLPFEESLNDLDIHHGHRRVYNPETFRREFNQAGLKIELFGGYFLKMASQGQMKKICSPEMMIAYCELGERYPDTAAELYIIATSGRIER